MFVCCSCCWFCCCFVCVFCVVVVVVFGGSGRDKLNASVALRYLGEGEGGSTHTKMGAFAYVNLFKSVACLCVQSLVGDQGSAIDQDIGPPISGDSTTNYKTIKSVSLPWVLHP